MLSNIKKKLRKLMKEMERKNVLKCHIEECLITGFRETHGWVSGRLLTEKDEEFGKFEANADLLEWMQACVQRDHLLLK